MECMTDHLSNERRFSACGGFYIQSELVQIVWFAMLSEKNAFQ